MYKVGILTLSDMCAAGEREDVSGARIRELLPADVYEVAQYRVLPDDRTMIEAELIRLADVCSCDLILTSGGTGFSQRDVTPEATLAVATRNAPGIAEALRAFSLTVTRRAMLSREASVIRGHSLIINLPGSPKAVTECMGFLLEDDTLSHGLEMLLSEGSTSHEKDRS